MNGSRALPPVFAALSLSLAAVACRRAPTTPKAAPAETVTVSAPSASELLLSVDSASRIEVLPGTPLVFECSLAGSRDFENAAGKTSRLAGLRLVDASSQALAWKVVARDGAAGSPTLVLEASAESTGAVPPGTYTVRALIDGPPRLSSRPVTVVFRRADGPDASALEDRRLRDAAEFDLDKKRYAEARKLAEGLLTRAPRDAGAWILLGDCLDGQGKPREALNAYRQALRVRPHTYDEPTLLYRRMAAMLRKTAS